MPATTVAKSDPLVANHFFLEIDGEVIAQLSEVSGLDVELEVTDIQQQVASGQYEQRKAFSKPKWTGEISIKRLAPIDATQDALWKWFNSIREKGMTISSLDAAAQERFSRNLRLHAGRDGPLELLQRLAVQDLQRQLHRRR